MRVEALEDVAAEVGERLSRPEGSMKQMDTDLAKLEAVLRSLSPVQYTHGGLWNQNRNGRCGGACRQEAKEGGRKASKRQASKCEYLFDLASVIIANLHFTAGFYTWDFICVDGCGTEVRTPPRTVRLPWLLGV